MSSAGPAELAKLPQSSLAVTGTILVMLRWFFKYSVGYQMPQWGWDEDFTKTKLVIETGFNPRIEQRNKRPAIAVTRGPFVTRRATMGDVKVPQYFGSSDKSIYSKEVHGTIGINVYSLEGGEAESIANLIFEFLITHEHIVEQQFKFKWLGDVSIGSLTVMEEDKETFMVPLQLSPVIYEIGWSVKERLPEIKKVYATFRTAPPLGEFLVETLTKEYYPPTSEKIGD